MWSVQYFLLQRCLGFAWLAFKPMGKEYRVRYFCFYFYRVTHRQVNFAAQSAKFKLPSIQESYKGS